MGPHPKDELKTPNSPRRPCPGCGLGLTPIQVHLDPRQCVKALRAVLRTTALMVGGLRRDAAAADRQADGMRRAMWLLVRRAGGRAVLTDMEMEGVPAMAELVTSRTEPPAEGGLVVEAKDPPPAVPS